MKIQLRTTQAGTTVQVDGSEAFKGGRVAAKRFANDLAKRNNTTWENVKAGGAVVVIRPAA